LGVGLTTLPCKKEIVEKPPRNSAIFNGRRLRRRPRPKLGCGAGGGGREREKNPLPHRFIKMVIKLTVLIKDGY
jgi:hypothetical protein